MLNMELIRICVDEGCLDVEVNKKIKKVILRNRLGNIVIEKDDWNKLVDKIRTKKIGKV